MEFITGKHIERRTFLKGMGTTVALPFLDAMVPAGRLAARSVTGLASAAWECHVPRPRIAVAKRTFDQQDFTSDFTLPKDDGNGGLLISGRREASR